MLVGLGGLWLVGFFWAQVLAQSLSLTREIRFGWAHVGDRLELPAGVAHNASVGPEGVVCLEAHRQRKA